MVYGFGRIDASGRVADRATIAALGWRGGDRLTLTADASVMIARRDPGGMVTVPARRARPGQRQVVAALAAGELVDRVLGDAEQWPRPLTRDQPERAVHHCGWVRVVPGITRGGDGLPPASSRPGRGGQADQLRIGRLTPAAEIGRELRQRLIHTTQRSRAMTGRWCP